MDALNAALAALAVAPVAKTAAAPGQPAPAVVTGERIVRTIHPVCKVLDAKKGLVQYIASDESLDSYREIVRAAGWQFDRFRKNAPFLDSHDYSTVKNLLGCVTDFKVDPTKGQLVETVQWAIDVETNDLARLGFAMTEAGYLKAVSVGFAPVKWASRYADEADWQAAVGTLKLSAADASVAQVIYLQQQQLELSACVVGANGNAVAKAYAGGALTDEDLDRLTDAAEQIFQQKSVLTGSAPAKPADGAETQVRQDRTEWLRELQVITNRI